MDTVWTRLAEVKSLIPQGVGYIAQSLGMDSTVSAAEVRAFFDRPELDASMRGRLIDQAPADVCAVLLASAHATLEDIETALTAHPGDAGVLAACAASLGAADLTVQHLRSLPRSVLAEIALSIRYARYDALAGVILEAIVEDSPDHDAIEAEWKASAKEGGQSDDDALFATLRQAHEAWQQDVYAALLAVGQAAWPGLLDRSGSFGACVSSVLLDRGEHLNDQALIGCLPHLLHHEDGWDERILHGRHLGVIMRLNALRQAKEFPRYREIAGDELAAVIAEAVSLGWMPRQEGSTYIAWKHVNAAAFFAQDPELLDSLVPLVAPPVSRGTSTYYDPYQWRDEQSRRELVRILLENPSATEAVHDAVLNSITEEDLRAIARDEHTEPQTCLLIDSVLTERATARAQAEQTKLEAAYPLPDDKELAERDNPQAALINLIRATRQAPNARRTVAIEHVLASRHTTAHVAWHLPAVHLFRHAQYGPQLARELAELCGSSEARWQCLQDQANPDLSPNLSAHKLLERIAKHPAGPTAALG